LLMESFVCISSSSSLRCSLSSFTFIICVAIHLPEVLLLQFASGFIHSHHPLCSIIQLLSIGSPGWLTCSLG
jgi:hypothetical protein